MTRTIWITMTAMLLLIATGCATGSDEIVTLEECPAAVQQTINARLDGGTIKEIERTTDHGEVLYEVDVQGVDGVVEFDVAEDGTFRGFEEDDDADDSEDDEDDDDGNDDEDDDDEDDDDDDDDDD